jgi:hypothetical protein
MIRFTAQSVTVDAAAGEEPTRTISGIAVPYGVEASVSTGQRVRVEAGALPTDGPAPRLLQDHDPTQVIGMVTAREDTPEGCCSAPRSPRRAPGTTSSSCCKWAHTIRSASASNRPTWSRTAVPRS